MRTEHFEIPLTLTQERSEGDNRYFGPEFSKMLINLCRSGFPFYLMFTAPSSFRIVVRVSDAPLFLCLIVLPPIFEAWFSLSIP